MAFRGFSDYASGGFASASTTAGHTLAAARARKQRGGGGGEATTAPSPPPRPPKSTAPLVRPSPIYAGANPSLAQLFRKIGQKRDPITKVKALEELAAVAFPAADEGDADTPGGGKEALSRPDRVAALSHLAHLHATKLGYDNHPSVRGASYAAVAAARRHVPKAWAALFLGDDDDEDDDDGVDSRGGRECPVAGMAWCAAAPGGDPAAEASRQAAAVVDGLLLAASQKEGASSSETKPGRKLRAAACRYAKTVLGCKRPSALQEVLHPSSLSSKASSSSKGDAGGGSKGKKGKSKKGNAEAAAAPTGPSDAEREEMDERYERVVLSAMCGLGRLLECCPEGHDDPGTVYATVPSFPEGPSVTRLTQSARGAFRRGGYALLGTMCQCAPSLVVPAPTSAEEDAPESNNALQLGGLIPPLLAAEKDPANFAPLCEMILSYLSATKTGDRTWKDLDAGAFAKALGKALRRGCGGAPAAAWGPTILPMVATLPLYPEEGGDEGKDGGEDAKPLPLLVVSSLWEGRKSAAAVADSIAVVAAAAECATFLLLRRPTGGPRPFSAESWRTCGQLFLDALSFYLVETNGGYGPVASAVDELGATLSRDLAKLDGASSSSAEGVTPGEARGIDAVKSWLWGGDGLGRTLSLGNKKEAPSIIRKWGTLLQTLLPSSSPTSSSHLIPACKGLFCSIVDDVTVGQSNKTCNADEGALLLSILRFCGVGNVFPINPEGEKSCDEGESMTESIERFCVNDILRWILVHASSSAASTRTDFEILRLLLEALPSSTRQKEIWETILRELAKSYCDYTTLALGLTTLARYENVELPLKCEALDAFATDTADKAIGAFRRSHDLQHHEEDSEGDTAKRRGNLSLFLETCVGIAKDCSVALISTSVARHWIHLCCQSNERRSKIEDNLVLEDDKGANVVLKTLLKLASSSKKNMISQDETVKLIYQSWLEGGSIWNECAGKYSGSAVLSEVVSTASSSLCDDIQSQPPADHALLELVCQAWAKRAARLIGVSQVASHSLDLVGLNSVELWDKAGLSEGEIQSDFLFLCLMYLLHSIDSDEHRRDLLLEGSKTELFVHIQTCIASSDSPLAVSFQSRTSRNHQLTDALGGSGGMTKSLLEDYCMQSIEMLSSLMKDEALGDEKLMTKALTSLSYIASLMFDACENRNASDDIVAEEVKQGESLFYEKGDERQRVKATVVKVHTDDFPNLYFTIKEESSNNERQTVASRLKRYSSPTCDTSETDDSAQQERVGRRIVDSLVKPFLSELQSEDAAIRTKREVVAESMNVVISQCGLVGVGIGSVRYDIFQAVSSWEQNLSDALTMSEPNAEPSLAKCIPLLRNLSLAMGYGIYTTPAHGSASALKMDPSGSISKLLELYDNKSWVEAQKRDGSMEPFHSSVLMWLAVAVKEKKDDCVLALLCTLTEILLQCDSSEQPIQENLGVNSYRVMRALSAASDSVGNEDEKNVICKVTRCFVNLSLDDSDGLWMEAFSSLLHNYKTAPAMLLPAASSFSSELCDGLFDPVKRWCAFQILQVFAKDSQPLQSGDDIIVPPATEQQLAKWKEALDEEESIELEEDVNVAVSWLPERLLSLLQSIGNNSSNAAADPQDQLMGNLLVWNTALDILDVAGSVDMRNRSHISSFVQKTNALGCIMKSTLEEADLGISRPDNIFSCIDLDRKDDFLIEKIATLALFRTVETLPTLVKTWYNDDCPRFTRQKLSAFVETIVAPATLQRDLVRIKDATSFGEMTVSGSCVSREVIATYQQDECQLSVMVSVPSTFPLRNVEVDCQKTIGIPEKRWRRWALQIMLMLNNQDGSVLDALLLWKQNVDKEFEGVEPCPVCYSVLCIKTHQMPNLECKTCQNRFHSQCLFKWFQSSGKSNCVLCQQPWSGTRV